MCGLTKLDSLQCLVPSVREEDGHGTHCTTRLQTACGAVQRSLSRMPSLDRASPSQFIYTRTCLTYIILNNILHTYIHIYIKSVENKKQKQKNHKLIEEWSPAGQLTTREYVLRRCIPQHTSMCCLHKFTYIDPRTAIHRRAPLQRIDTSNSNAVLKTEKFDGFKSHLTARL